VVRILGIILLSAASLHTWGCSDWQRLIGFDWHNGGHQDGMQLPVQASLPTEPASLLAAGPIVPRSAGLQVPQGYWTRLRVDALDYLYPYSWGILEPSSVSVPSEQQQAPAGLTFRLLASHGPLKDVKDAVLRGVIQIAAPGGTEAESLVGLEFQEEALRHSSVSIRLDNGASWLVDPTRLAFSELLPNLIKGVLEGRTRPRKTSKKSHQVRVAFMALRAPKQGQ
jgi:hypothetical protein